jgi:hypothetical protein
MSNLFNLWNVDAGADPSYEAEPDPRCEIATRHRVLAVALALGGVMVNAGKQVLPQEVDKEPSFDALIAAYPDALARYDAETLYWRDGSATPLSDSNHAKSFAQQLQRPSIADQLLLPYPPGPVTKPPAINSDPGRFRNIAFFEKMYGNCVKGEVLHRLVPVVWLPESWGKTIQVTSVNGVDRHLKAVSAKIDSLPTDIKRAAYPIAGTYNCRAVADTGLPSPHSYGIAIDLKLDLSDYWYWQQPHRSIINYRNQMPNEIVKIFEDHGFIWGGKWYHYDTMHFEYRPELLHIGSQSAD